MTRTEHLEFCKKCLNRKFDSKQGWICNLTSKVADFETNCASFEIDAALNETGTEDKLAGNERILMELDAAVIDKLKIHQEFYYAAVGGLLAAVLSAVLWAVITVATEYQIGFMAVGVGLLVGFSVQFFGAGIDKKFGYLGAVLSIVGCLLGNLFSQVGFIAMNESLGYFEVLSYLNLTLILSILTETFSPVDFLFYGIALYEGYRLAFRKITAKELELFKSKNYEGYPPNYKLRMPAVIGSVLILGFFLIRINMEGDGLKTFYYETGEKMSEGEFKNSKEEGKWNYWYENGNLQSSGFFSEGVPDSLWQWYNTSGDIVKSGHYKKGLEHGLWLNYFDNGTLSDSGSYYEGRMNGQWKYWDENGNLFQLGYYKRNQPDGIWKTYYSSGQLSNEGKMTDGNLEGEWRIYDEKGSLISQVVYENDKIFIENVWDLEGNQIVVNGNGHFKSFSEGGVINETGKVENGMRTGIWMTFHDDGTKKEEGEYFNDQYLVINSWDLKGNQTVTNGTGTYVSYYPDGESILETGEVIDGLREGAWKTYFAYQNTVFQEHHYVEGKLTGPQKTYFVSGQLSVSGEMTDGLKNGDWTWYFEDGSISSTAEFKADKKEGKQTIWSEVGEKTKEEYYKSGKLISEKILCVPTFIGSFN